MDMLYDTRTIHPLDRYDYYRAGAGTELAPVAVQGCAPARLLAAMSVAQIGDFAIETVTWSADSEIVTQRTEHLIQPSNLRPDQFARDFKQHFGVSATQVRRLASQRPTGRDG
jgi:hypothetical protein